MSLRDDLIARVVQDKTSTKPRIAVVGDVMLDEYVTCDIAGLSNEERTALKLNVNSTESRPGGAANVAHNLVKLQCDTRLFGIAGSDALGEELERVISTAKIDSRLINENRFTTHKLRYMTRNWRHITRVDRECTRHISYDSTAEILTEIARYRPDLIVVSDYGKGVVTPDLMEGIRRLNVRFIVDPKGTDYFKYKGSFLIKPNDKELKLVTCSDSDNTAILRIRATHDNYILLVTYGMYGARGWLQDGAQWNDMGQFPVRKRMFCDPTGCGDSAMAGLAYTIGSGWGLELAISFSMAMAACSCDHPGAYAPSMADIFEELSLFDYKSYFTGE